MLQELQVVVCNARFIAIFTTQHVSNLNFIAYYWHYQVLTKEQKHRRLKANKKESSFNTGCYICHSNKLMIYFVEETKQELHKTENSINASSYFHQSILHSFNQTREQLNFLRFHSFSSICPQCNTT